MCVMRSTDEDDNDDDGRDDEGKHEEKREQNTGVHYYTRDVMGHGLVFG